MPNVPAENDFKERVRTVAYSCQERNGLIWAYMGPEPAPPLPEFEANMTTDRPISVRRVLRKCNWVQALEGDIDSSHLAFAHRRSSHTAEIRLTVPKKHFIKDIEVGSSYAAVFDTQEGVWFTLISHFLFPCYVMVPFGELGGHEIAVRCWVPLDDYHTLYWDIMVVTGATETFLSRSACEYLPATSDPLSRFNPVQCSANDYLLDRGMQQTTNFMGISLTNVFLEDQALTESMGRICDRSREHLGVADKMIIRTRRRLINAARALHATGIVPPGVETPEGYRRRAVKMVLSPDTDVFSAADRLITLSQRAAAGLR
jgi:hypothetical protein